MSNLVARIRIRCPFGNLKLLSLREAGNRELVASLVSLSGTPESIGNLQLKRPLPAFWADRKGTLAEVTAVLREARIHAIEAVEVTPIPPKLRK